MEIINARVADAVRHTLGEAYAEAYRASRNQICEARGRESGADLQVFFAVQVFKQHTRALCEASLPKNTPLHVTVISPFGLVHDKIFVTSKALGAALVDHLMEDDHVQTLVADMRHDDRGRIKLTTKAHLEWHTIMGRLPCSLCGLYFNGAKGLRVHKEIQHQLTYTAAQHDVRSTQQQLIVYTAPPSDLHRWHATATEKKLQRRALEPGLDAARRGDLTALRAMVDLENWDPTVVRDVHGNNALLWAAIEGHLDVCKYLHGAFGLDAAELQGKLGRNALHWAARGGHRDVCAWLMDDVGVDVDCPTLDGTTPLHYAVYGEQLEMVKWLVAERRCDVHRLNVFGCNASQWCAMTDNVAILRFLVECGNLNCAILNRNGHSALHKAAIKGHEDICMWLLTPRTAGGGGLTRQHMQADDEGFTPINFATANGHARLGARLQAAFDGFDDLLDEDDERSSKVFLEKSFDQSNTSMI
ncbi:Aste57867_13274 [Aphanomyces stellatus]|uniref:Aste57867_13274 protein n=1 Tax=Aphanomyces stellatus TaxID=120398 RepID=A0A485KY10_9STRA|nr:hypothetical protein As57867_013225 [Aphanomyces stellatus]VFT90113.1 Aste57867_13274 [Aphanomyces stellatus]